MKRSGFLATSLLVGMLDDDHKAVLKRLFEWHSSGGWRGIMALLPWTYSESTRYHFSFDQKHGQLKLDACSSAIEAHRRAINIEGLCARLVAYLHSVVDRSTALRRLAPQHLNESRLLIASGVSLYGAGPAFWACSQSSGVLAKLSLLIKEDERLSDPAADLKALLEELQASRAAAFQRRYVVTELDWGMPLLALASTRLREPLSKLDDPAAASEVLRVFTADQQHRIEAYCEDLKPLLRYGGQLTELARRIYGLASAFKVVGDEAKIAFPENCKFCQLDGQGSMLGLDGKVSSLGHMQFSLAGKPVPPIQFPDMCRDLRPLTAERLEELTSGRVAVEQRLCYDMLTTLQLKAGTPKTVELMLKGRAQLISRLQTDSHLKNLTHILPPTASMPEAIYEPGVLFGA